MSEKIARVVAVGAVTGIGLVIARKVCNEAYDRGFKVNHTWPDGKEPIIKK